ncbi:ricin-type beta-trefoil lectin domain protein [Streptomyces sp. NPDC050421]|uniref:RICIN domain-containing protein n=1 Tax=unclassified Streptomyces TaxID=2593676 RepID=UPI0037904E1A
MSELPKRNVSRSDSSRPAKPLRSNDALNLDSARAALARAIAAQRAESTEGGETEAGRSAPAQGRTEPGLPRSSAESVSAHEIPAAASPRRWAFLRRRWVLATAAAVAVAAVVAGVAVTVGGGSDSSGRRADAPAEGLVESDSEYEGAGGQSLLPGAPTAEQSASPSVTPSVASSPSSGKSAQATPHPGRSTAATGSGSSSATGAPATGSATKPGSDNAGGSTTVKGVALAVQASGKCLTGAGSGAQLLASACGGSAGQSWSPQPDGSLRQGGLCVTVTGTEDRTPVVLATCDRSSVQRVSLSGTALVSASTGKCLDLFGGASGTQIVLWECNGRDNQHWTAS